LTPLVYGYNVGDFNIPLGLNIDAEGNILVCDSANHQIQKINQNGVCIAKFGAPGTGNGELNFPKDITSLLTGPGNLAVTESSQRIQIFDSSKKSSE